MCKIYGMRVYTVTVVEGAWKKSIVNYVAQYNTLVAYYRNY